MSNIEDNNRNVAPKLNMWWCLILQRWVIKAEADNCQHSDKGLTVEDASIARAGNNIKESCMKNPLSLVNGDELAVQSRGAGTGKKTKEEINGARGCPVFMAVAE